MKNIQKLGLLLLSACLVGLQTAPVLAEEPEESSGELQTDQQNPESSDSFNENGETVEAFYIDPNYESLLTPEEVEQFKARLQNRLRESERNEYGIDTYTVDEYSETWSSSIDEAALALRQGLLRRDEVITVSYPGEYENPDIFFELMDKAAEHNGTGSQGDYLRYSYCGWSGELSIATAENGSTILQFTYSMEFNADAAMEKQVTEKLGNVYRELALEGKDDLQKTESIYRYICEHVTYSYETLENPDDRVGYSAYGALINGTSVCQGYAMLLYRMLNEQGVDARIVTGGGNGGHAWNIVGFDDMYYTADSTWDAGRSAYSYFLVGSEECSQYSEYPLDERFLTPEFQENYPISPVSYCKNPVYADGTIEWADDYKTATALFTCQNCSRTVRVPAEVTRSGDGNCQNGGEVIYTASAEYHGATARDEKHFSSSEYGHEYVNGFCRHCHKEQPVSEMVNPYSDVSENEWYYGMVMTANQRNLMTGLSEGVFGPDENISRGMVAVILWRMSGAPSVTFEPVFDDVKNANDYYAQAVTWAAKEGLITGYDVKEDGKKLFGPDDNVTREQLAVFFCRYAAYQGKDTSARNDLSWFEDKDSVSPYARTAMQWMVGEGMIQGEGGKRLNPLGEAQRSHMAKFSVLMDNFVRNPEKNR